MILLIKSLIFSFALEGGIIPTNALITGVPIGELEQTHSVFLNQHSSSYVDMQVGLEILKYAKIEAGMMSYQLKASNQKGFVPFRMDYNFGCSLNYNIISIGWQHGCDHTFTPLINKETPYKLDFSMDRIYAKVEFKYAVN